MAKRLTTNKLREMYADHYFDEDTGKQFTCEERYEILAGCFNTGGTFAEYEQLLDEVFLLRGITPAKKANPRI